MLSLKAWTGFEDQSDVEVAVQLPFFGNNTPCESQDPSTLSPEARIAQETLRGWSHFSQSRRTTVEEVEDDIESFLACLLHGVLS